MKGHTDSSGKFHPHSGSSGLTSGKLGLEKSASSIVNKQGYEGFAIDHDLAEERLRKKFPNSNVTDRFSALKKAEVKKYGESSL